MEVLRAHGRYKHIKFLLPIVIIALIVLKWNTMPNKEVRVDPIWNPKVRVIYGLNHSDDNSVMRLQGITRRVGNSSATLDEKAVRDTDESFMGRRNGKATQSRNGKVNHSRSRKTKNTSDRKAMNSKNNKTTTINTREKSAMDSRIDNTLTMTMRNDKAKDTVENSRFKPRQKAMDILDKTGPRISYQNVIDSGTNNTISTIDENNSVDNGKYPKIKNSMDRTVEKTLRFKGGISVKNERNYKHITTTKGDNILVSRVDKSSKTATNVMHQKPMDTGVLKSNNISQKYVANTTDVMGNASTDGNYSNSPPIMSKYFEVVNGKLRFKFPKTNHRMDLFNERLMERLENTIKINNKMLSLLQSNMSSENTTRGTEPQNGTDPNKPQPNTDPDNQIVELSPEQILANDNRVIMENENAQANLTIRYLRSVKAGRRKRSVKLTEEDVNRLIRGRVVHLYEELEDPEFAISPADPANPPQHPTLVLFTTFEQHLWDQRLENTLTEWAALGPWVKPLLFVLSNVEGMEEAALHGWKLARCHPAVQHGAGIVSCTLTNMFQTAQKIFPGADFYGYANANLLFDATLLTTLRAVYLNHVAAYPLLIIGSRADYNMKLKLANEEILSPQNVTARKQRSSMFFNDYVDYLITPRGKFNWSAIPAFILGGAGHGNHIVSYCVTRNLPVLDATQTIFALHQTDNIDATKSKHRRVSHENFDYNLELANESLEHVVNLGRPKCAHYSSMWMAKFGKIMFAQYLKLPCAMYFTNQNKYRKNVLGLRVFKNDSMITFKEPL